MNTKTGLKELPDVIREYKDARIEAAVKRNEAKEEAEAPDEDEEDDEMETGSLRDSIDKIWKKKR